MDSSQFPDGNISAHQLISALRQTHELLLKTRKRELIRYDLTPEQASALMAIHALGDSATTAELSRRLFRESNSMAVLVRRLEKRGLISKVTDARRKNVFRICLTEKGLTAYHSAMEMKAYNRIIKKMTGKKRKQLLMLLQKLRNYVLKDMNIDLKSFVNFNNKASALK